MILERTEKYAKEIDDVMFLFVDIVSKFKAGESLSAVAVEELQNALNAIAGAMDIGDEFAENQAIAIRTITARAGELAAALLKKPVVPPAPEAAPAA